MLIVGTVSPDVTGAVGAPIRGQGRTQVKGTLLAGTVRAMDPAPEAQMLRLAQALITLARGHGLSNLRLAGDGQIIADIADIAEGRTLLDVARFEIEAQAVLQSRVSVLSSRAELAASVDNGPLAASSAA
ncbi:MAG TPA: hypothetical protein PKA87_02120 [Microthrixaceae bacterium]|nr:hypothetical protein [Microthrixaceae bacterium]HMX06311.1 hypothetical protein [Microthrixaceae bacterium]HNH93989.1 hypothetical protein [Microthrixaceae bacterium]HNN38469.1 hypothetical protein [Microthrixaceae bacterium]